jgi:hypothetical protein
VVCHKILFFFRVDWFRIDGLVVFHAFRVSASAGEPKIHHRSAPEVQRQGASDGIATPRKNGL